MTGFVLPQNVRVRPAGPADIHRLVQLLPGGLNLPLHTRYLVAEGESIRDFIGGAFLSFQPTAGGGQSAFFQLAVPEEHFTDNIFPLLLRACIAQAQSQGARTLSFGRMVAEGDPLEDLLIAHSFSPIRILTEYEMDGVTGFEACDRICQLLQRRGKIPKEASDLPLSQAAISSVLNFIQRYLGFVGDPYFHAENSSVLEEISTVVQLGPQIVGAVIIREVGDRVEVPYDAVDREFRNSWVTPLLWRRSFRLGLEAGYKTVRFKTNEDEFRNFSNFARRMRSKPLGRRIRYGLLLES